MKWGSMLKRTGQHGRRTDGMSLARIQLDDALQRQQPAGGGVPEVQPQSVYPTSEIGSLADLLCADEPRRHGGMICPCCDHTTRRVVRVRPGGAGRWVAVCAMCAGKLLAGHPATVVGGRVRPRVKRAG